MKRLKLALVLLLILPTALIPQTIPGSPFGGSGGGAPFANPYSSLFTFGSGVSAADSIAFNSLAGCIEGEGSTADAFELLICYGNHSADNRLTFTATGTGVTMTPLSGDITVGGGVTASGNFGTTNGVMFGAGLVLNGSLATAVPVMTPFITTLTESSATTAIQVNVASGAGTGGRIDYCVRAADATDQQERCAFIRFAGVNKAGTETCGMTNNAGTADASITELEDGNAVALSTGTLTYTITCSTASTNALDFQINAVSSLTQTTLEAVGMTAVTGR